KALDRISKLKEEDLSPAMALRYLKGGVEIERQALGANDRAKEATPASGTQINFWGKFDQLAGAARPVEVIEHKPGAGLQALPGHDVSGVGGAQPVDSAQALAETGSLPPPG